MGDNVSMSSKPSVRSRSWISVAIQGYHHYARFAIWLVFGRARLAVADKAERFLQYGKITKITELAASSIAIGRSFFLSLWPLCPFRIVISGRGGSDTQSGSSIKTSA
jgi:hypothetical protein